MKLRPVTLVFALALAIFGTGCSGLFGNRAPEESAVVSVLNDLDPPGTMTIEIQRSGDDENTLGTVGPGEQRDLTYKSRNLQGAYKLIARQPSGAAVVSREFTMFSGARVRWQMRTNDVSVTQ